MNIEIKYQAEDGEIRYYHFESWELDEDDAFREAMQEFRSTRTGKNKILSIRDASIGAGRNWKNNPPDDGRWYRPKPLFVASRRWSREPTPQAKGGDKNVDR